MTDPYKAFFDTNIWRDVLEKGDGKDMDPFFIQALCLPETRTSLYEEIKSGNYCIFAPHKAEIPKPDGGMRTIYINKDIDRILLAVYNNMLFSQCSDMIHPACKSYLKGSGCGQIVRSISRTITAIPENEIGVKLDLSKYFDSVKIEYIDRIFDRIKQQIGPFEMTDAVKNYYHDDTVIENGQAVQKYTSLKQGCPVSAFLADAVLYDIDKEITENYDVKYIRYSDDILILGKEWKPAFETLKSRLSEMELAVHPRKTEYLFKDKWFKFLGFMIKGGMITVSPNKIQKFEREIRKRVISSRWKSETKLVNTVMDYLYLGDHSWASGILPYVNVQKDIATMNQFIIDAILAKQTKRFKIGNLSANKTQKDHIIQRSVGSHVRSNKEKRHPFEGYLPLTKAAYLLKHHPADYDELLKERKEARLLCRRPM